MPAQRVPQTETRAARRPVCVALATQTCSARARAFQTRAAYATRSRSARSARPVCIALAMQTGSARARSLQASALTRCHSDQPEPRRAEGSPVKARAGDAQPAASSQLTYRLGPGACAKGARRPRAEPVQQACDHLRSKDLQSVTEQTPLKTGAFYAPISATLPT